MSLSSYVRAIPKVELHVHLEGTIRPATLLALAKRNGVDLAADTVEELARLYVYDGFEQFVDLFVLACRCLRTAEDYELIVYEYGAELARQNVRYAEVTYAPSTHHVFGVPHDTYFAGMQRGRARARADFGVELAWIPNIVRRLKDATRIRPLADYVTSIAIEDKDEGVVALGLGGAESGAPPEPFAPWFDRARAAGLHSAPHAGEFAGPASVWGALRALGAERIAHGVRAIEDPSLLRHLAERGIALDVCPRSNICLGVYDSLASHPLPRLHAAGVVVTVSSDDPPFFNATLADELATLVDPFRLDVTAIDAIVLNAVRASFLPAHRKQALEAALRLEMDALKKVHLL